MFAGDTREGNLSLTLPLLAGWMAFGRFGLFWTGPCENKRSTYKNGYIRSWESLVGRSPKCKTALPSHLRPLLCAFEVGKKVRCVWGFAEGKTLEYVGGIFFSFGFSQQSDGVGNGASKWGVLYLTFEFRFKSIWQWWPLSANGQKASRPEWDPERVLQVVKIFRTFWIGPAGGLVQWFIRRRLFVLTCKNLSKTFFWEYWVEWKDLLKLNA